VLKNAESPLTFHGVTSEPFGRSGCAILSPAEWISVPISPNASHDRRISEMERTPYTAATLAPLRALSYEFVLGGRAF
jgi:hypothetical protein